MRCEEAPMAPSLLVEAIGLEVGMGVGGARRGRKPAAEPKSATTSAAEALMSTCVVPTVDRSSSYKLVLAP